MDLKKLLLSITLVIASTNFSFAQTKDTVNVRKAYCDMYFAGASLLSLKVSPVVNFEGTSTNLLGEDGKVLKFNEPVDFLNYMAKRGWSVTSVYFASEFLSNGENIIHYLMQKDVTSDSQVYAGLRLYTVERDKLKASKKKAKRVPDDDDGMY